jgi:hypothetical protein
MAARAEQHTIMVVRARAITTGDHLDVLPAALTPIARADRENLLVRADGAGASHDYRTG